MEPSDDTNTSQMKEALADTVLPGPPGSPGISVLKGDTVCYNPMTLHQRRDLYPPVSEKFADPALFSPERWYTWQPKPWEYIPFNGGPRIVRFVCPVFFSFLPTPLAIRLMT
jgi:hypothetical protein